MSLENALKCLEIGVKKKLGVKFPAPTLGYSVVRIFHLGDAIFEFLELEASPTTTKRQQKGNYAHAHAKMY